MLLFLFFSRLRLLGLENHLLLCCCSSSSAGSACWDLRIPLTSPPGRLCCTQKLTIHPTLVYIVQFSLKKSCQEFIWLRQNEQFIPLYCTLYFYTTEVLFGIPLTSPPRSAYVIRHPTLLFKCTLYSLHYRSPVRNSSCTQKTNKLSYFASWPPMLYTKLTIHPTILYILQFTSL